MSWLQRLFDAQAGMAARSARSLHEQIVTKARAQEIYTHGLLPDSFDGRFHAVALYSALVFPRLEQAGKSGRAVSNALNQQLFDSFDAALRETGVGDASIARKTRKMGESFFGLGQALNSAFAADEPVVAISDVLVRNRVTGQDEAVHLAHKLVEDRARLDNLPDSELIEGKRLW